MCAPNWVNVSQTHPRAGGSTSECVRIGEYVGVWITTANELINFPRLHCSSSSSSATKSLCHFARWELGGCVCLTYAHNPPQSVGRIHSSLAPAAHTQTLVARMAWHNNRAHTDLPLYAVTSHVMCITTPHPATPPPLAVITLACSTNKDGRPPTCGRISSVFGTKSSVSHLHARVQ